MAALGWSNCIGHAEFTKDELGRLLAGEDANGEVRVRTRQQLKASIDRLVEMGLLEPGSGVRCLMPASAIFDKASGGSRTCFWHGRVSRRR